MSVCDADASDLAGEEERRSVVWRTCASHWWGKDRNVRELTKISTFKCK